MTANDSSRLVYRLADLVTSLEHYELLSTGVRDEINEIVPGGASRVREMDDDAAADALFAIVNKLRWRRLEPVLALHELPHPHYPVGEQPLSDSPPAVAMWDPPRGSEPTVGGWKVLGFDVGFPIGIPSCELTCNADWIEYYARKGFHILTYRTVRNVATGGSPFNWVFLSDVDHPWGVDETPFQVHAEGPVPCDWRAVSTATSFVAPCPPPHVWQADMREARRRLDRLGGHHLLIASVTDSVPAESKSIETLAADFVAVAKKAEDAGAQAVECYLARASAKRPTGDLQPCERSSDTSIAIVKAVRAALRPETRLLVKLSGDLPLDQLEEVVVPLAEKRLIDGVSGISPARVKRVTTGPDGRTLWEEKAPGVAGFALRDMSRAFLRRLADLRERRGLRFEILAMGGVTTADDVSEFLELGASAVQAATAAVSDPGLAAKALARYRPSVQDAEEWDGVVERVDPDRETFWVRLVRTDVEAPDEEAQFEMNEIDPWERNSIGPGAVLTWRTDVILHGGKRVRRSLVGLKPIRPLSEADRLEGRRLAAWVADGSVSDSGSPM